MENVILGTLKKVFWHQPRSIQTPIYSSHNYQNMKHSLKFKQCPILLWMLKDTTREKSKVRKGLSLTQSEIMIHIMKGSNQLEWCWRKLFHLLTAADSCPNNRPKFGNRVHYHWLPCQHINFFEIYQKVLDSCPNNWPKFGNRVHYHRLPCQHI